MKTSSEKRGANLGRLNKQEAGRGKRKGYKMKWMLIAKAGLKLKHPKNL